MRLPAIATVLLCAVTATAAVSDTIAARPETAPLRPVTSAYTLHIGSNHQRDTYLTPVAYSGWSAAIGYERFQAMRFDPDNWIMRLQGTVSIGAAENHSRSATMWDMEFSPSWAMMRRFKPAPGLTVAGGGIVRANLGAVYLDRNSNNPLNARAAITVGITAMATYDLQFGRLPVTLRYQPSLPLIGAFFSPDYDELYYEIWLGNHSGLCHCAWPGSYIDLENLITADLRFGATALRLGYRNRVFSTKASGIVTRHIEHEFVIGISTEWLSLDTRRRHRSADDARIITAFY